MMRLIRWAMGLALGLALLIGVGWLLAWQVANKDVAPVSHDEIWQRLQRTTQWFKDNESRVLDSPNAALWWMIADAAERGHDPYLQSLANRAIERHFSDNALTTWKRVVRPKSPLPGMIVDDVLTMAPYQLLFIHGLTCQPMALEHGDTSQYLTHGMCKPTAWHTAFGDPACITHQYMALQLFRRGSCPLPQGAAALEQELIADIEWQLRFDPVVKDSFFQRLLVLSWFGHPEKVKPIWLKRALMAQSPDGGWLGRRRIVELPDGLQPWAWGRRILGISQPDSFEETMHATAQMLLLQVLVLQQQTSTQR
jgi:hypothetical protein